MQKQIKMQIHENSGIARSNEPITIGIPFPQGCIFSTSDIIFSHNSTIVPFQAEIMLKWPDNSIKWALFDFQYSAEPKSTTEVVITIKKDEPQNSFNQAITIKESDNSFLISTGVADFTLNKKNALLLSTVSVNGFKCNKEYNYTAILTGSKNEQYTPTIETFLFETKGPFRTTLKISGFFCNCHSKRFCNFVSRISFYAGKTYVKNDFTLHNPRAAKHQGGLWDLGDKGSILFKDLSITLSPVSTEDSTIFWKTTPDSTINHTSEKEFLIYQDSSGGKNWQSTNHVNRYGEVKNSFKGYQVSLRSIVEKGERAQPIIAISNKDISIEAGITQFWQNFPKAIDVSDGSLRLRLFPEMYNDLYELQGGEQKTHTFYITYSKSNDLNNLNWIHSPLIPSIEADYYVKTDIFSQLSALGKDSNHDYTSLIKNVIEGPHSFLNKREIIDEYGWRNFGDIYADHEAINKKDGAPLISHYNNQYDCIYGLLIQYMRSSDDRWCELAYDLAKHVIDIDIYHTTKDKSAYNNGLFWHTDHYTDAYTSTHRTYSHKTAEVEKLNSYGGGPSNEHNYTSGLLMYFLLSGDHSAKETVTQLADWVINMDKGRNNPLKLFTPSPTGFSSKTVSSEYHGPGRGAGNSINALIDAHVLTQNKIYLNKAEELLTRCIHPEIDISSLHLNEPEDKWSYLVFLQVIGKYLDYKIELNQKDYYYYFARDSLIHFAKWMLENEKPYSQQKEKMLIWTETWPAQEIRKSCVFDYAAKYSNEPLRTKFLKKSDFFYTNSISELTKFKTKTLTRPMILMICLGSIHDYFLKTLVINKELEQTPCTYKPFIDFIPQKMIAMKRIKKIVIFIALFGSSLILFLILKFFF